MNKNNTVTFKTNADEITLLFQQAKKGKQCAMDDLVSILYQELKIIASSRRRSFAKDFTLNTTALVNETWLKLKKSQIIYNDKGHFLSIAAIAMRQILLDVAKKQNNLKQPKFVMIDIKSINQLSTIEHEAEWLYQLDLILLKLEKHSSRKAAIFNLKFFCGFTLTEIAEFYAISTKTVQRDWESAKLIISKTFELI